MGNWYVDETIQSRGGFILAALLYSLDDPTAIVHNALAACGYKPGVDEFHSSALFAKNDQLHKLRDKLRAALHGRQIAIVVAEESERPRLGNHILDGLTKVTNSNRLPSPHYVWIDQGIEFEQKREVIASVSASLNSTIYLNQDSKTTAGLQLADLVAHTAGTMLLGHLGIIKKLIKDEELGYPVELDFTLWASLRYQFFLGNPLYPGDDDFVRSAMVDTSHTSLHIVSGTSKPLSDAAHATLGAMYMGCIH